MRQRDIGLWAALITLLCTTSTFAQTVYIGTATAAANPLLAIDQHRTTVIDRIVAQWGEPLASSDARLASEQLRTMLSGLRADHLLAASLAGTLDGLRNVLAVAVTSTASVRDGLVPTKALGEASRDLVYTPINPCRIVDTRLGAGGFMPGNTARDWNASRPGGNFTDQGGSSNDCAIPAAPAALLANFAVTGSSQPGVLFATAFNQPAPTASTLNYAGGQTIANAVIVPAAIGQAKELHIFVSTGTHVVIDVMGYFKAPGVGGNIGIGTNNPVSGRLHVEGGVGNAVFGHSTNGVGVFGRSTLFEGVRGEAFDINHGAVVGIHNGGGIGVFGTSTGAGVEGNSAAGRGVVGSSTSGTGVYGVSAAASATQAGVYGVGTAAGGIGVTGEASHAGAINIGLFGTSASPSGYGIYARNSGGGLALYAESHAGQAHDKGGLVKSMIVVNSNGTIARCYNGLPVSSSGNCGFSVSHPATGIYDINFGYQIGDRFVTTDKFNNEAAGGCFGGNASAYQPIGNVVRILTSCTILTDAPFVVIVF